MKGWIEVWDRYNGETSLVAVAHIVSFHPQGGGTCLLLIDDHNVSTKQDYNEVKRLIAEAS